MIKIILQDIDNVLFPFKEKHAEFLFKKKLISDELFSKFLKSNKPYLINLLIEEIRNGVCKNNLTSSLNEKYELKAKELFDKFKKKEFRRSDFSEEELELIFLILATFDDFRESEQFQSGLIKETINLNKEIKQQYSNIKIIGITAREAHINKELDEFDERIKFTHSWNINNNVGLDKIYFEKNKINAYHDLKKDSNFKDAEILFFLEDDPKNIENFLKEGITCILILFDFYDEENLLVDRLKNEYGDKLLLAENHLEACNLIKKLLNDVE